MMDDRKSTNCVNCKTAIFLIEVIILHSCEILFTFSSVREKVIRTESTTRANIQLFVPAP